MTTLIYAHRLRGSDEIVDVKLLISRRPDKSGREARNAYPIRSSIEPMAILLKKQKYRIIAIGQFMCRAIAGALGCRA
jgi:hypothetical protein